MADLEKVVNPLCAYNDAGEELLDPVPAALNVNLKRPIPLGERVRALVRSELLARAARDSGVDTFEDADDFEVPDDPIDKTTPYEDNFDPGTPGIAARQMELKSGFVSEIPEARRKAAQDLISKYRKKPDVPPAVGPIVAK